MRLRIGGAIRPLNECVASISYAPTYDVSKRVTKLKERWDISGRIVLQTNASQTAMTAAIERLRADFSQEGADLVFLEDFGSAETALALRAQNCLVGPYIVDSSFPNSAGDIYSNAMSYRIVFEAETLTSTGTNLIEFSESVTEIEGGPEEGYVGGAVNYPERQVFMQNKPFRYKQSGSAVGLLARPTWPPPIWPFAMIHRPQITKISPRVLGNIDTEYGIQWEYEFAWHQELFGEPHRRV